MKTEGKIKSAIQEKTKSTRQGKAKISRIRRRFVVSGWIVCFLFLVCGCGKISAEDAKKGEDAPRIVLTTGFEKDEVFRIGKSSCSTTEFMIYMTNLQNRYEAVYGSQIWSISSNGILVENRMKDTVAARIAQIKTMNLLAQEYGVTLTAEEEKSVEQAAGEYLAALNEREKELLQADRTVIESLYREYAVAHSVYAYIIRDINPEISDDEARTVTVDWIFFRSAEEDAGIREKAEEVRRALDQGETFDALASAYSDDKTLSHSFAKGDVDAAIEECAFNLAQEEVSGVVKGEAGYYILRCVSTLDRKQTDANKEKIITRRKGEAFNEVYGTFAAGQVKQLNEEVWESISMIHDAEVSTGDFFDIYRKYFPEDKGL